MSCGLEDLPQNVLRHAWIQAANVESPFVRFGCSTTHVTTGAGGRHHVARHGRRDRGRNWIGVLRDDDGGEGRRWHVGRDSLTIALGAIKMLLARRASRRLGDLGQGRGRRRCVFGHCRCYSRATCEQGILGEATRLASRTRRDETRWMKSG